MLLKVILLHEKSEYINNKAYKKDESCALVFLLYHHSIITIGSKLNISEYSPSPLPGSKFLGTL